jgi:GAF domain-containing protein
MAEPTETTTAYGDLLGVLVESPNVEVFLDLAVRLAADTVVPGSACGLTVRRDGRSYTAAASSKLASQLDEFQYGADEGPCLEALRTGRVIEVGDLANEQRWNEYRPHALAHGVASGLSVPMQVDGQVIAALNWYAVGSFTFLGPARRKVEGFARHCAAALTVSLRQAEQAEVHLQLREAMAARTVIDQAIGILMAQQRCAADEAFELLRGASQHRNRKLREVAVDVVTRVSRRSPRAARPFQI